MARKLGTKRFLQIHCSRHYDYCCYYYYYYYHYYHGSYYHYYIMRASRQAAPHCLPCVLGCVLGMVWACERGMSLKRDAPSWGLIGFFGGAIRGLFGDIMIIIIFIIVIVVMIVTIVIITIIR